MATRSTPDVVQRVVSTYDPKGARAAAAAVKQFEKDQVSAAKVATTAHGNILSSFLAMATGANTHLGSLSTSGGKAVGALKDIENSGYGVAKQLAIGVAGAALAAGSAITAMAIKGVGDFVQLADQTHSLELRMGGSAEQASRLIEAGGALGVSSDSLGGAFFKLSKAIEGGAKDFDKYGIQVAKTKGGGVDLHGTLLNVIDAFNATSDPVERDRIAFLAFGKSGADMIPILQQGRAGLAALEEAAKNVMTEDDIRRAKEYEMSQKRLEESNKRLTMSLGRDLLPAFSNYSSAMAAVTGSMDSTEKAYAKNVDGAKKYGDAVDALSIPVIGGIVSANSMGDALNHAHDGEAKVKQAGDDARATVDLLSKAMTEATKRADDMTNAFMAGADADYALQRAGDSFNKSLDDTARAQDALTKLQQQGGAPARQITELTMAEQVARERLVIAIQKHGQSSVEAQAAQVAEMHAQDALTAAQAKGGATTNEVKQATDALKSAQDAEVSSAIAQAKATAQAADEKAKQAGNTLTTRDNINLEIASLQASAAQMNGPSRDAVNKYIATLQAVPAVVYTRVQLDSQAAMATIDRIQAANQASGYTGPHVGRAGGGPVVPNRIFTVGEKGPEQVTFDRPGHVYPTGQGPAPGPGGAPGGGGMVNNFYGDVRPDQGDRLGRDIAWAMKTS